MSSSVEQADDAQAALVAAAASGDQAALRSIWEANRRWIAAVLIAHKPALEDLDDLLQEVAVTLVDKLHTIREAGNVQAWLRTVAVNAARAAGRSGRYRRSVPLPEGDVLPGGAARDRGLGDGLVTGEELARLVARLEQLPPGYREPLLLRSVHGMKSKQVGRLLGIPPATVDTRVARARRMLREPAAAGTPGPSGRDAPSASNGVAGRVHTRNEAIDGR